jgi:hypothetical protein
MKMNKTGSKQDPKGFAMVRKCAIVLCVLALTAWGAQDSVKMQGGDTAAVAAKARDGIKPIDESRLDKIEQAVSNALSKAGVNFGGEFRSQFLTSGVEGRAVTKSYRKGEDVEFTSVDFDVSARPASELSARLIFRFYEDWRNMWISFQEPICSRWISVDGLVKNVFSYNVGDFKQKYSPLTLYSPDVDIAYEPEIFAQQRKTAMKEMFLGDNERVLQGVNMNFDAEIVPALKELHWNVLGSRLRNVELVSTGAPVALHLDTALMDKYVVGSNLNMTIIPGLSLGGTFLDIFDATPTFGGSTDSAEMIAQNTRVFAGRGEVGTGLFMDEKTFSLAIGGEVAVSSDDSSWQHVDTVSPTQILKTRTTQAVTGTAATVDLKGILRIASTGNVNFDIGFLNNQADFRNDLAQSPTFFRTRIMNTENDVSSGALYSTFDALYRQVFKFSPSENAQNNGSLAGWLKGPVSKIAYGSGILTQKEMRRVPLDNAISTVMPFGPATPNRSGVKAGVSADFLEKAILVSGSAKFLNELDGQFAVVDTETRAQGIMPQSTFLEAGGGASVDLAALGRFWRYPLIISGGYTLSRVSNDGAAGYAQSPWTIDVGFVNAGLYWTFLKKASLLGGYQLLVTDGDGIYDNVKHTLTQLHWSCGLEYKLSDGARLTGSFGGIEVSHKNDAAIDVSAMDFRQYQTDLFLTVTF